ncbi:Clp protease N-terminal domain-containing protein [Rhizohabitans arisaemae]|uniref:Clp protease N-terminal domain-containing protein n=1 Tax=Rhizohabitans arisaemae TaxID=2720610 RepID=UPI0024B24B9D|nr:Clp protease N-terminal domain-containing protein [Rhizohabitans arisaemae]
MFGAEKSPFAVAIKAAAEEARQRGDRRIGTEHLLLGLLRNPDSTGARALGVDLAAAQTALAELDKAALRALGLNVGAVPQARPRKHPAVSATTLTTSARAAITQAIKVTKRKDRDTQAPVQVLLALLAQRRPDPVADLLDHLGVDRTAVRTEIESGGGHAR